MDGLPARGPRVRELGLELPPTRARDGARPLKRWRYVGVYTPELMLCVGDARVGPIPQRWWAVALPDGRLHERTTVSRGGVRLEGSRVVVEARDVRIDLGLEEGEGVEIVSPHGGSWIWTCKQANVPARGTVTVAGREAHVDDVAFIDDSAGYHARSTAWRWSAGHGRLEDGRPVGWNLVTGVHDGDPSERTVWLDGEPHEVGPVEFAGDLSRVGAMEFNAWSVREDHTNLGVFRSDYRQPFGTFGGELPGGLRLTAGYGVMEEHDVRW
jgi:hypothetical protein